MKLSLHVGAEFSLENFSLSQLVFAVKELFDNEGLPGFLSAFLKIVEQSFIQSGIACKHCQSGTQGKVHAHGTSERTLRTSLGIVKLNLIRVKCQACKKTFTPLNQILDLDKFDRKTREFEKLSIETIAEQSFRRSSVQLEKTIGFPTAHTTLHRWFTTTKSIATSVKHRVKTLIADGTGYKKKIDSNGSNRGEVKVVIGLTSDGELVPFGAWTRASWNDLANYIKRSNHASEKIKFRPIAELLVTDGEEGLIRAMKKLANQHQRCLFHMTHEIGYLLKYKDNASQKESEDITDELARLLYLQMPELTQDPLKNLEEKLKIEIEFNKVKKQLEEFIKTLKYMGYTKAKNFVENAKSQLYTYIESWLKTGDQNPKVTSLIERVMREIKRRIKKIGSGWSEAGAERMTRLILLRLSQTKHHWEDQWKSRLGTDAQIKLTFLGVTSEI